MMNEYIGKEIKERGKYFGLFIPPIDANAKELVQKIEKWNFSGFKPYYTFVKDKNKDDIRIIDFVTQAQLEVANDKELLILLHIPRKERIADPANIEDIINICLSWPKAKIVLAHIGRSYGPYFLEKAIDKIKDLENLYYDLAAVNDGEVIELLLENVSPSKVIYGTDIPITLERGKHLCINRQCVFITRKKFGWSISDKNLECTYFVYETIRAIKWAAKRRRLIPQEIEDIFYNNAKRLLK
jgi:predicted TIM-barrel fold metal-dependent hydrolase